MALYIPYVVGVSVASYMANNVYSYMTYNDTNTIEIETNNTKENTVLTISEEPIVLESIIPEKTKLESIKEEEINDTSIEQKLLLCTKCKLYLPTKCFSKNQFKKKRNMITCKVCNKLG